MAMEWKPISLLPLPTTEEEANKIGRIVLGRPEGGDGTWYWTAAEFKFFDGTDSMPSLIIHGTRCRVSFVPTHFFKPEPPQVVSSNGT